MASDRIHLPLKDQISVSFFFRRTFNGGLSTFLRWSRLKCLRHFTRESFSSARYLFIFSSEKCLSVQWNRLKILARVWKPPLTWSELYAFSLSTFFSCTQGMLDLRQLFRSLIRKCPLAGRLLESSDTPITWTEFKHLSWTFKSVKFVFMYYTIK